MKMFLTALVALALPIAANAAPAQSSKSAANAPDQPLAAGTATADDNAVLVDLHKTNLHEIAMGKMAQDQGKSDAVKEFGKTLEKDHKEADKKVQDVATSVGVKLPEEK